MNHITIAGRLVEDPVRKEANGSVVTSFRIASGRSGSKSGRLWIDVDTWGRLAGTCHQHLGKGRHVLVSGRLTQKEWANSATGAKHVRYLVTAHEVEFLGTDKPQAAKKRPHTSGFKHRASASSIES